MTWVCFSHKQWQLSLCFTSTPSSSSILLADQLLIIINSHSKSSSYSLGYSACLLDLFETGVIGIASTATGWILKAELCWAAESSSDLTVVSFGLSSFGLVALAETVCWICFFKPILLTESSCESFSPTPESLFGILTWTFVNDLFSESASFAFAAYIIAFFCLSISAWACKSFITTSFS